MYRIQRSRLRRVIVGASATLTLLGIGVVLLAAPASAQGTPTPWAPGGVSQDGNAVGGIAFFNAAGNQITSGSTSSAPFAKYAIGLVKTRTVAWTDTKAIMQVYVPTPGQTPDQWSTNELLGTQSFPVTAAGTPSFISSSSLPDYSGAAADDTLDGVAGNIPQSSSATGYANTYEVRIYTNAPGHSQSTTYDYADITINPTTHTWAVVYSPGNFTTTALASSENPSYSGDNVTFTATESPAVADDAVRITVED